MGTRVLHVMTRLAHGGSEGRLHDVVRAVPAEHVVVVGRDSHPSAVEALLSMPQAGRCQVLRCPDLIREVEPRADARAYRQLAALARQGRFDVVHTHQSKAGLLGRVAARRAGVSTVYHSASMASFGPAYGKLASLLFASAERVTAPLVTRYFVVGRDLADRLAADGISRRRLQVVRSSLDLASFVPAAPDEVGELRRTLGVDQRAPVVCYVGSLEDRKGVTSLSDVVREARPDGAVTLLVAGDGPGRAGLEAQAARADPGLTMRLLGHVRNVADVMRASDVLVLPSSAEGLPQVLVQAASCGLPFVAYDVDGVGELLSLGAPGRMVPFGDRAALVTAVAQELARSGRSTDPLDASDAPVTGGASDIGPNRWASWSPTFVEHQYRRAYRQDLGTRWSDRSGDPVRPVTG